MRLATVLLAALGLACLTPAPGHAHFSMLLPSKPSAEKGEEVTFTYQFGHPFEHELSDAEAPLAVEVLTPDGKKSDLLETLKPIKVPGTDGKPVTAFQFAYKPEQRGDHVFVVRTVPILREKQKVYEQEIVKAVLHVQTQNGWDGVAGPGELVPLTRPYALRAGCVFQVQVAGLLRPDLTPRRSIPERDPPNVVRVVGQALVEIERYNPKPPKELPPDEFITAKVKTDPAGTATCTLPEAGWWAISATYLSQEEWAPEGKEKRPVRQRSTLWVQVVDKVPFEKPK